MIIATVNEKTRKYSDETPDKLTQEYTFFDTDTGIHYRLQIRTGIKETIVLYIRNASQDMDSPFISTNQEAIDFMIQFSEHYDFYRKTSSGMIERAIKNAQDVLAVVKNGPESQ